MLAGEGKALNVDPCGFYKTVYALLPAIIFERNAGLSVAFTHAYKISFVARLLFSQKFYWSC